MWPPQRVNRTLVPSLARASPTSWPPVGMAAATAVGEDIGMGVRCFETPSAAAAPSRGGRLRALLVPERAAEDLPDLTLGKLLSELDHPRYAEGREPLAAEGDDLLVRRGRTGLQHDER